MLPDHQAWSFVSFVESHNRLLNQRRKPQQGQAQQKQDIGHGSGQGSDSFQDSVLPNRIVNSILKGYFPGPVADTRRLPTYWSGLQGYAFCFSIGDSIGTAPRPIDDPKGRLVTLEWSSRTSISRRVFRDRSLAVHYERNARIHKYGATAVPATDAACVEEWRALAADVSYQGDEN